MKVVLLRAENFKRLHKLEAPIVATIRRRVASGETVASVARDTGMSEGALRHIVKRRHWRHVP